MRTHGLQVVHSSYIDTMDYCIECGRPVLYRVAVDGKPIALLCGNDECDLFLCEVGLGN